MVASLIGTLPSPNATLAARQWDAQQRQQLSLAVLAGVKPVRELASEHGVSAKFCYQQARKARVALNKAFEEEPDEQRVLFTLAVTKAWLRQFVLALVLICHSSFRAILDLLESCFDYPGLSLGTIHNILGAAAATAASINRQQDLSSIEAVAFDEIYQSHKPVLTGRDVQSLYCVLLCEQDNCDGNTWGYHFLELSEAQGLHPTYTLADAGPGLRAGQAEAWPGIPCFGDVFHPQREWSQVVGFLKHRAEGAEAAVQKGQRRVEQLQRDMRCSLQSQRMKASRQLTAATHEAQRARQLYEDIALLGEWFSGDVLAKAGEPWIIRSQQYDWILAELAAREELCPHRLPRLRRGLEKQRQQLLAFVARQEELLDEVAQCQALSPHWVQAVVRLEALDKKRPLYWQRRGKLLAQLGGRFPPLEVAVKQVLDHTQRSSSLVENLNSQLRCYFFLRRHLGQPYLDLLRFYLNHHRLIRSQCPQRAGKSPVELLTGRPHPHWLEMLGHLRFHRN